VAREIPQAKFIAVLRDPVSRAYSHYWHQVRKGFEPLSFEQALLAEDERLRAQWESLKAAGLTRFGYFYGGCYAARLEPYLRLFPRGNFFFLLQEDLRERFQDTLGALAGFLGADEGFAFSPEHMNSPIQPRNRALYAVFQRARQPFALKESLKKILPRSLRTRMRSTMKRASVMPAEYPPMLPATERELRARYAAENRALEPVIDRDLSAWMPK
jgi:hypothetical protein